jgi:D-glycero-D-manno-heptose 1,7-bisphosphate phosphatase
MSRGVFLDRDGVLNRAIVRNGISCPPSTLEEFEILSGVVDACSALKEAGYVLVVVTNQPDVARGTQRREVIEAMNAELVAELPVDDVRVCYHDDSDQCACRKPNPGMLLDAARDWGIDLAESFMIGDRWKDIEAGKRAGCTTILLDDHDTEKTQSRPDQTVHNLYEAATWILKAPQILKRGSD